jgi:hypothetical protein
VTLLRGALPRGTLEAHAPASHLRTLHAVGSRALG